MHDLEAAIKSTYKGVSIISWKLVPEYNSCIYEIVEKKKYKCKK